LVPDTGTEAHPLCSLSPNHDASAAADLTVILTGAVGFNVHVNAFFLWKQF
jgi:hypothetical protein